MKDKVIIYTPDPPEGYGAFDQEQGELTEEEIKQDENDTE